MNTTDILTDKEDGELLITDGDIVIGEGRPQQVATLLQAVPGEIRHAPTLGFGIAYWLKQNTSLQAIAGRATKALDRYGYAGVSITPTPSGLEIEV